MPGIFESVRGVLGRLTPRQKIQLALAIVGTVGLIWGISQYATRVRYGVLFSSIDPEDASLVVTELRERSVPYRLAASGRVVEVPIGRIDELRMEMAGEGLPRGGGSGFEIFDKPSFGLSDFVQNVNYRRALERELARSVQSLDTVSSARVHLALPRESVFADEKRHPSASVIVRLRGGRVPSGDQVQAITHLVASGVEGLDAARVSVVDADGRMLTDGSDADEMRMSAAELDAKRSMEQRIERILVAIVEPVVGAGRVRAQATVELETARVERVEERYDPDGAVVRSEQKNKMRSDGAATGGVPGTESNLPGGDGGSARAGSNQSSQSSTTNFEINKTVSTIAEPRGSLQRQSVAVVVDNAPVKPGTPDAVGVENPEALPRTQDEMRKITDLVRAAVGIDETRGDVLIVENVPFDETLKVEEPIEGLDWVHLTVQILRYLALPFAVLLVILLVIRPGIAALRSMRQQQETGGRPLTVAELQARLGESIPPGGAATLRQQLVQAASQDPQSAALVVRGWLDRPSGD